MMPLVGDTQRNSMLIAQAFAVFKNPQIAEA